ncbi:MAG: hypothetical protein Kow00120_29880 [Anaerolineae bacterium]
MNAQAFRYVVIQEQERPPFVVRDCEAVICGEVARCWTREDAARIAALLNADDQPAAPRPDREAARLSEAAS